MLKKCAFLCICILNLYTFIATAETFTGRVTGNKVRVRTQPNLDGYVVKETNLGDMFAVTGEENGFYCIMPPKGTKGYVFRTFILDGVVEGDRVNVRLNPDLEAPIIATLQSGDHVQYSLSPINNKWYEVELPSSSHFFVAKEYIEKCGPIEMLAQVEARHLEATHHLSAAFSFAQSEIQKPFEEIDIDSTKSKLTQIAQDFSDVADIVQRAHEINQFIQEAYVQKKIAFLEDKSQTGFLNGEQSAKLVQLGLEMQTPEISKMPNETQSPVKLVQSNEMTDKMKIWVPLEEACYHLWALIHGEKSMDQFYDEEKSNTLVLSGIVEAYDKPVRNRPGDYLLKNDNIPVAYLYSTCVDLQKAVGKKVVLHLTERPNNHFAFPAYFVHAIE